MTQKTTVVYCWLLLSNHQAHKEQKIIFCIYSDATQKQSLLWTNPATASRKIKELEHIVAKGTYHTSYIQARY